MPPESFVIHNLQSPFNFPSCADERYHHPDVVQSKLFPCLLYCPTLESEPRFVLSATFLETPPQSSLRFSSTLSYLSPPLRDLYSFDLKSLNRTTTGLGYIARATFEIPSESLSMKSCS